MVWPDEEYLDAMRAGIKLANSRGVTAVHDKDGWLGALRLWRQLEEAGSLSLRVWQSIPHDRRRRGARGRDPLGLRQPVPEARLPEGVHGRDARFADRVDARRQRRADHERRGARRDRPARRRGGLPRRRARDRRPRQPRSARRVRGDARRLAAEAAAPAHRARAAARARGSAALRRARRRPARCSSRTRRRTAISPTSSGPARRTAPTRSGRCSSRARCSATAATRRSRSSIRSPGSAPACGGRSTTAPPGTPSRRSPSSQAFHATCVAPAWLAGDERRRGTLIPGQYADLVVLDRDPWDDLDAQVVATMVGGRWVHNPPPWN